MPPASMKRTPVLRGRAPQQDAITALLAAAKAGRGGGLVLRGALGQGKTALLRYAASAASGWCTNLSVVGLPEEAHLPYAALHRLLQPVLDHLPGLPADQARALRAALGGDPGAETPVLLAVRELLSTAAHTRPVLCCVDNAQALDPPSLDAVAFVARRSHRQPVVVLAATCAEDIMTGVPCHELSELDSASVRAMLADLLSQPLPEAVAAALITVARGNPQAVLDLAAALTPQQRAGTAPAPVTLPAGPLRSAYQARLRRLPADTRQLLLIAAADPDLDTGGLVRAARVARADISALTAAELSGLIRITDAGPVFPQPLLRTVIYTDAPLVERRRAHLHLAEAAAAQGQCGRASLARERVAELTSEPVAAARQLISAARYAWVSGDTARARGLLHRVRELVPDGADGRDVAGERLLLAGEIELRSASAGTALESLLAAAEALAGSRDDLALRALMRAGEAACFAGEYTRYREIAAKARRLPLPAAAAKRREAELLRAHIDGFAAMFGGHHRRAAAPLRRVLTFATRMDADPTLLTLASTSSLLLADHQGARRFAAAAVECARSAGDARLLPLSLGLEAYAAHWLGHYAAAAAAARDGLAAARSTGQDNYAADHLALLAVLAAIRGDRVESRQRLRELILPPDAGRCNRPKALRQWALAVLDVTAGRAAAAASRLAGIADPVSGEGQLVIQVMATPWLVEAAARTADQSPAVAALTLFHRWAESTGEPVPRALAARCHALLAPRGSEAAEEHFRAALRLHADGDSDYERARTELLFGQELRRCRRPRQAREHLHRAAETFRQVGLPAWEEQATSELRAAGEPVEGQASDPAIGATEALTAQQVRIARLVAEGATNQEVAAKLFLSPRTVDYHLRNIFHRLGIRSRVELVRLLA